MRNSWTGGSGLQAKAAAPAGGQKGKEAAKPTQKGKGGGKAPKNSNTPQVAMISIPKQLATIIQSAAERACEGLTDPVIVTAEKNKEWEYVSPSAMKFFNMHKKKGSFGYKTCQEMA